MKKIVIFLPSIQHGGVYRTLLEALNVIEKDKYDVTVYSYGHYNPLADSLPEYVNVIIDTDKSHYLRKLKSIKLHLFLIFAKLIKNQNIIDKYSKRIKEYIHDEKSKYPAKKYFSEGVDVAISYNMGLCTQMAVNVKAKRRFVFFHSSDPNFHRDLSDKYFKNFDNIVAVGENVQKMLIENFPIEKEKIALIQNYINPNNIIKLADEYTVDTITDDKRVIITSVIRVDKEKGADLLVDAAARLKEQGVLFKWYIVGDGAQRDEIEEQIQINNLNEDVFITGYKENPYPYIKTCDVFVHPTYEESFGLAILEALILGKKVVSTETMGAKEVLNNGEFGLLVPTDANSIASAIVKLVDIRELKNIYKQPYTIDDSAAKRMYQLKWETILDGGLL